MNNLLREVKAVKKTQALQYDLLEKIYGSKAQDEYKKDFPIKSEEELAIFENKIEENNNFRHGVVSYSLYFKYICIRI